MTEPMTLFMRTFGRKSARPTVARRSTRKLDVTEREWRQLRARVFARDHYTCRYCGAQPPLRELHADHVIPRSKGGASTDDNVATACGPCNLAKGTKMLGEWRNCA